MTLNWKGKIISCILVGGIFFGMGYGVKACVGETKPDYSVMKVAEGFYQDADIELTKIVNGNNGLEIYLEGEYGKIPLKDDLLLGDNNFVYNGLEKRLEENTKENEQIIDEMFRDAYELKLSANKGNQVKEGYANPSDIKIKYNKTSEGDYLSIENKLTNEELPITKNNDRIQVGDFDYQYQYFKDLAINKASEKYDTFMEKLQKIFPFLGALGWGS